MPRPKQTVDGLTKFQRYRQQQQRQGMKQLRIWVPDPNRPEFVTEAKRQGLSLRGRAEEAEASGFIAAAFEWPQE
ncbi:antitoxin MazE-like protein [Pleomorphomonas sp. PLEO]|uniref:antitoxin MazE-like protein n=1 Tax=Pleomorphomonas sp. PLEO TaxID=3239306 RepID=UPI00351E9C1C